MAATDGARVETHRGMGLVNKVFDESALERLAGCDTVVGHVRYSTTGSSRIANAQPLYARYSRGWLAVAHNGNLTNGPGLRAELESRGSIFQTTSDSEVVLHLAALPDAGNSSLSSQLEGVAAEDIHVIDQFGRLEGAFSLLVLTPTAMIGVRDRHGFRPLWLGKRDGAWAFASETAAFDMSQVESVREVEPGEAVIINRGGEVIEVKFAEPDRAHCFFEFVYFARPDSRLFGETVHLVRKKLGRRLFDEQPVDGDVVIPIPDSGNAAALGYSEASGIPLDYGFVRNHYVGRSFIEPGTALREKAVELKLNVVREVVAGKRIVVVDDSVIRGNTARRRVHFLRQAGAKEVHLRISCPPHRHPCHYGIDFQSRGELVAANKSMEELRESLGLDTLGYLSVEGMLRCVSSPPEQFCVACWSGNYPTSVSDEVTKFVHEAPSDAQ